MYIPGDYEDITRNGRYIKAIDYILDFALDVNTPEYVFPVYANSFGLACVMHAVSRNNRIVSIINSNYYDEALEISRAVLPTETFLYDEFDAEVLDELFDDITVYSKMSQSLTAEKITTDAQLKEYFIATATFSDDDKDQEDEYVAVVEGINFPFIGLAFSPEKVLFNAATTLDDYIDTSIDAVRHA